MKCCGEAGFPQETTGLHDGSGFDGGLALVGRRDQGGVGEWAGLWVCSGLGTHDAQEQRSLMGSLIVWDLGWGLPTCVSAEPMVGSQ